MHFCWATAHLCDEKTFQGVFAVAQACCQPVMHSSSEQGPTAFGRKQSGTALLSLNTAAVHWCMVAGHLHARWILIAADRHSTEKTACLFLQLSGVQAPYSRLWVVQKHRWISAVLRCLLTGSGFQGRQAQCKEDCLPFRTAFRCSSIIQQALGRARTHVDFSTA